MMVVEHASISDQGPVRQNNEDCVGHAVPPDSDAEQRRGWLFLVCDGVGGSIRGEEASQAAVETVLKSYYASNKPPGRALRDAISEANQRVYDLGVSQPKARRSSTTLTALVLASNQMYITYAGDTRVYRIRGQKVEQLTKDHSEVWELVRLQIITAEEAKHHPRRSVITRSLGQELILQCDSLNEPVEEGDIFVMCSDGVWEPLTDSQMLEAVQFPAEEACKLIIDFAIAGGTDDNVSVQVIKVSQVVKSVSSGSNDEAQDGFIGRLFGSLRRKS